MTVKQRPYRFYDTATSICSQCLERVDGKIVFMDGAVWMLKRCPDHEQHGCMVLIEVTDHCNLRCPTCYAGSSPERLTRRNMDQIRSMVDFAANN